MKSIFTMGFISMPFIAWLPAKFWTFCGDPWCLNIYPYWLDRFIYSIALPYLNPDISMAAEQMEFLEVWITTMIILEIVTLLIWFLFKKKFSEDYYGQPLIPPQCHKTSEPDTNSGTYFDRTPD